MFTSGAPLQVASRFSLSALEDGRWTAALALDVGAMGNHLVGVRIVGRSFFHRGHAA